MGIKSCNELPVGTLSGKFGERGQIPRYFHVEVDDPYTSRLEILAEPGLSFGDGHPGASDLRLMEWKLDPVDDTFMLWLVSFIYYAPPPEKNPDPESENPDIPRNYWEATGGTSTVPVWLDIAGNPIVNSAGDPLEGFEKEENLFGLVYHKFYANDSWVDDAREFSCSTNSDEWAGGDPETWKCEFKRATGKEITTIAFGVSTIVETAWEFYFKESTWRLKPLDLGFAVLVDEDGNPSSTGPLRKVITGRDGKGVRQPVALDGGGGLLAAGLPPLVINGGAGVAIYPSNDFGAKFGTPSIAG